MGVTQAATGWDRVGAAWTPAALLSVDTLSTVPELERLLPEWMALWAGAEAPLPFTHPGWMLAWWRTLGGGALRVFTVRAGGWLVAVLPMFIYLDGGVSRLLPLGISVSDAFELLAEPGWSGRAATELARVVQAGGNGWDRCELHEVPPGSVLRELAAPNLQGVSPVLDLARFAALPSRAAPARRLVRARRAAAGAGLVLDRPGPDTMDALFALHAAQWQARGEPGVLATPAVQAFHRQAADALAEAGTLRLHRLRNGAQTVAVLYGFQLRDRAYAYASGIHPDYAHLGLGTVLIGAAIDTARADGARELDFLRGSEPYKYAWGAIDRALSRFDLPVATGSGVLRVLAGGREGAPIKARHIKAADAPPPTLPILQDVEEA